MRNKLLTLLTAAAIAAVTAYRRLRLAIFLRLAEIHARTP
jgi:hypothetical protein